MPLAPLVFSAKTVTFPSSPTLWMRLFGGSVKYISPLALTAGPSVARYPSLTSCQSSPGTSTW